MSESSLQGAAPPWMQWVLSYAQDGLLVLDSESRVVFVNKWLLQRARLDISQVMFRRLVDVFSTLQGGHFEWALKRAQLSGFPALLSQTLHPAPFPLHGLTAKRSLDKFLRQSVYIIPMGPKDAEQAGDRYTLVQIYDVTHTMARERLLRARVDKMHSMAHLDALTGVGNRRFFEDALATEVQAATRSQSAFALIMLDIDHFKQFNDHYGHPAGDRCLQHVAELLRGMCNRPRDKVARYGGEEFALILPGTQLQAALQMTQGILQGLRDLKLTHPNNAGNDMVTLSAGITVCMPPDGETGSSLVQQADQALYAAKSAGRNCLYYKDPSGEFLRGDETPSQTTSAVAQHPA